MKNVPLTYLAVVVAISFLLGYVSGFHPSSPVVDYSSFDADLLARFSGGGGAEDDLYNNPQQQQMTNNEDMLQFQSIFDHLTRQSAEDNRGNGNDDYNDYSPREDDEEENEDQESESHSSLTVDGTHQYVSGGAGEGSQHLQPDGAMPNTGEIKSDEDLPAYCNPPNPCPVGYEGEDCDRRPFVDFNAEFSRDFQDHQSCMCDSEHNACRKPAQQQKHMFQQQHVVAKKSPVKRRLEKRITNM